MKNFLHDIDDDLLVKYLLAETNNTESLRAENWINAGDRNKKYFEDLKRIWEESKKIAAVSSVNEQDQWNKFTRRIASPKLPVHFLQPYKKLLRIAAILFISAGTAWLGYMIIQKPPATNDLVVFSTNAESKTDTLPDKSVITLNKNAEISYSTAFAGNERRVLLKGEAFFNVTPDKKKPFIITVNEITVKVVGTSFNIKTTGGKTEVVVETGIVQVIRKNNVIELKPSEKITVAANDPVLKKEINTDKLYKYYRSKEFECNNTPLWKVVAALNEAYDANIIIENKNLAPQPLTTTFSNESLDNILNIIRQTFNISVVKKDGKIILQ